MRKNLIAAMVVLTVLVSGLSSVAPGSAAPTAAAATFNSGKWTALPTVGGGDRSLANVSCTSSSFCMVATSASDGPHATSYTWNGRSWSKAHPFSGYYPPSYMSCGSPRMCVGVAEQGYYTLWDGTSWSPEALFDPDQQGTEVGLSCASATLCVAVDSDKGTALIFSGHSWSSPSAIDPTVAAATAAVNKGHYSDAINMTVACVPGSTTCVVVDGAGDTVVLEGTKWVSRAHLHGLSEHATDGPWISCPAAKWCMVNGGTAKGTGYWTWDGASWGPTQGVHVQYSSLEEDADPFSCASAKFCGGFATSGWAIFAAGTWHSTIGSLANIGAISCPTDTFCLATGSATAWAWRP